MEIEEVLKYKYRFELYHPDGTRNTFNNLIQESICVTLRDLKIDYKLEFVVGDSLDIAIDIFLVPCKAVYNENGALKSIKVGPFKRGTKPVYFNINRSYTGQKVWNIVKDVVIRLKEIEAERKKRETEIAAREKRKQNVLTKVVPKINQVIKKSGAKGVEAHVHWGSDDVVIAMGLSNSPFTITVSSPDYNRITDIAIKQFNATGSDVAIAGDFYRHQMIILKMRAFINILNEELPKIKY